MNFPNVAKWISHICFPDFSIWQNLLPRKCLGIVLSQPFAKWNRNEFCPSRGSKDWDLHRQDAQTDRHRKTAMERQGQDELLNCVCLCVFFIMHGQIFNSSTNYLSADTPCICLPVLCTTSPPFINLFFLFSSGNWKAGSLVTAAHCYIHLPLYNKNAQVTPLLKKHTLNPFQVNSTAGWSTTFFIQSCLRFPLRNSTSKSLSSSLHSNCIGVCHRAIIHHGKGKKPSFTFFSLGYRKDQCLVLFLSQSTPPSLVWLSAHMVFLTIAMLLIPSYTCPCYNMTPLSWLGS